MPAPVPRLQTAIAALLLVGVLLTPLPAALADSHLLSREQAVELVRERTSGRILGVDAVNDGEFRVRVLVRQGEVRVFRVDRASGRVR